MTAPIAQFPTGTIAPDRMREIFASTATAGASEIVQVHTSTHVVAEIYRNRLQAEIARAHSVADVAAAQVFGAAAYQVREERSSDTERLAETMIVVEPAPIEDIDVALAAERSFYERVGELLPQNLAPIVEIVLKV